MRILNYNGVFTTFRKYPNLHIISVNRASQMNAPYTAEQIILESKQWNRNINEVRIDLENCQELNPTHTSDFSQPATAIFAASD